MENPMELWDKPSAEEMYMIIGWNQWADAGSVSSALPQYLIEQMGAEKIGEMNSDGFYLFQIPGTQSLLRPEINLDDGYPLELRIHKNEVYYTGNDERGLVIFLGDEPHLDVDRYTDGIFSVADELGVKRAAAFGGVYGAMPYDKDRQISCSYSMRHMKEDLAGYAVRFSNYEGGSTISSYMLNNAERRDLEYFVMHAMVPAYDLSQLSIRLQGLNIDDDYKAWYDIMQRINHMFNLGFDLSDLEDRSDKLTEAMSAKIQAIEDKMPQLNIREYLDRVNENFTEMSFVPPLDELWARELGDLLDDIE